MQVKQILFLFYMCAIVALLCLEFKFHNMTKGEKKIEVLSNDLTLFKVVLEILLLLVQHLAT